MSQFDICDVCHRSADTTKGQTDFVPSTSADPLLRVQFPFEYRFTCAACVAAKRPN